MTLNFGEQFKKEAASFAKKREKEGEDLGQPLCFLLR